jgi:hypothetical protein
MMHPIIIDILACILFAGSASAEPVQQLNVDWKLYGAASVNGKTLCFYQPDGHARVWTKCIPQTALEAAFENDPDKKITEATAQG